MKVIRDHTFDSFESILSVAKEIDVLLYGLSDARIRDNQAGFHNQLKKIRSFVEKIEDIGIINRDGLPLVTAAIFPIPEGVNYSDREFYRAYRDNLVKPGTAFISQVLRGRVRDRIFFGLSWPRKNELGEFNGVIGIAVEPNSFSQSFAAFLEKGNSTIALVRDDGAVLARSPGRQEDL